MENDVSSQGDHLDDLAERIAEKIAKKTTFTPPCINPENYKRVFGYTPDEQRKILESIERWLILFNETAGTFRGLIVKAVAGLMITIFVAGILWVLWEGFTKINLK